MKINVKRSIALRIVACTITIGQVKASQVPEFVVLVTSYNNENYIEKNLDSIFCQRSSQPFLTIYVNDCSKDGTKDRLEKYAQKHNLDESKLLVINNDIQLGSGIANIYNTVHNIIDDQKVVVCVDGDDYLSFPGVLERLEKEYADPEVWMTYGRFVVYPAGEFWSICWGYDYEIIRERSFRKNENVPSHLKTFRAKLFKQIKKEDLIDPATGTFYTKAWDMAMQFPMLEMCAPKDPHGINHSRFIEDTVLYIYNFANPIGDAQNNGRIEQMNLDRLIRSKPPYEPLKNLYESEDPV
jgi:glycosyltransferase involved in cell wall biosynthesis